MSELIEISTAGGPVLFDADDLSAGPTPTGRRGTNVVAHLDEHLEAQLARIRPAAHAVVDAFKALAPDEVAVEFGLRLDAEAGIVVAKTSGTCHFVISAKWTADGDALRD